MLRLRAWSPCSLRYYEKDRSVKDRWYQIDHLRGNDMRNRLGQLRASLHFSGVVHELFSRMNVSYLRASTSVPALSNSTHPSS